MFKKNSAKEVMGKEVGEGTEQIAIRVEVSLSKEFDVIAEAIPFSKKAAIMKECLKIGLEEFKRKRPDIMKIVYDYQNRKDDQKKGPSSAYQTFNECGSAGTHTSF